MLKNTNRHRDVNARLFPFFIYILLLALDTTIAGFLTSIDLDSRFGYMLRMVVVSGILFYYWQDYRELKAQPTTLSTLMIALIAGLFVLAIWVLPYPSWLGGGDQQGFNSTDAKGDLSWFWSILRISGAALVVPIMEELFWRSLLMRWFDQANFLLLSPAKVSHFAFFATAGLFALEHHLWLAGFIAGIVYGGLYKQFQNIWVPIFAHIVTNAGLGFYVVLTRQWSYW